MRYTCTLSVRIMGFADRWPVTVKIHDAETGRRVVRYPKGQVRRRLCRLEAPGIADTLNAGGAQAERLRRDLHL